MRWFFFHPRIDHARVVAALRAAEEKTTGEIRVLISRHKARDPVASAQGHFDWLGLTASTHRNGVLLFVAPRSRNFAIVGDRGIHDRCGDSFWTELAATLAPYFRRGEFTDGVVHGVERAGELLAVHFPRRPGDAPPPAPAASEVD